MRIFMLIQRSTARGPVPKHTAHLVAALRAAGCVVITHPWGQERAGESLLEKSKQRLGDVLSVHRILRHESFDVAVVKTAHDWRTLLRDIAVAPVLRRRCRHVVLQFHGSSSSHLIEPGHYPFKLATSLLLGLADGILVLSSEEQRQWRTFSRGMPVLTTKNPYVMVFDDLPARRAARGKDGLVLFVGRLIAAKGIFDLIFALPTVLDHSPCELVLVGAGDAEPAVCSEIHSLALDDHVKLTGYLSGPELMERYREATIFALPTSWDEGFPTVLAEAMDAGLPIVTTPIRGAADHLVPNENALFVEAGDRAGLASAILALLKDPDLRKKMGEANRRRLRLFEPDVVAKEYVEALEAIIAARRSTKGH